MRKIVVIGFDCLIVLIIMILYSNYVSSQSQGMELNTLVVGAGWFFMISLNFSSYILSWLANLSFSKYSFVKQLYLLKFFMSILVYYFFYLGSNYEKKERETCFLILSLLTGGLLHLAITYFSNVKHFFKKVFSFFENIWKEK